MPISSSSIALASITCMLTPVPVQCCYLYLQLQCLILIMQYTLIDLDSSKNIWCCDIEKLDRHNTHTCTPRFVIEEEETGGTIDGAHNVHVYTWEITRLCSPTVQSTHKLNTHTHTSALLCMYVHICTYTHTAQTLKKHSLLYCLLVWSLTSCIKRHP